MSDGGARVPEATCGVAAPAPGPEAVAALSDPGAQSRDWVRRLRADEAIRAAAQRELHELLLRAARFEVRRRRGMLTSPGASELEDIAQHSADDALVAILAKLGSYRGDSRFTTWAYKFALLEASVQMRRRAWRGREVVLEPEHWSAFADAGPSPAEGAQTTELLSAVRDAIATQLTRHQREVLVAITLEDVPIDVLAERLSTTRGALYKTLHDARRKLRARLAEQGLDLDDSDRRSTR